VERRRGGGGGEKKGRNPGEVELSCKKGREQTPESQGISQTLWGGTKKKKPKKNEKATQGEEPEKNIDPGNGGGGQGSGESGAASIAGYKRTGLFPFDPGQKGRKGGTLD